jgi:SAM-dependent MidA family methyltransferase
MNDSQAHTDPVEVLRATVQSEGPLPFAHFMALALECPELGYYEQKRHTPGRQGDFFTSVSVGSVFGELLAWQFDAWHEADGAGPLQLVEAGAQDGSLAVDLLTWLRRYRPQVFARTEYFLLEPSRRRQEWQRKTLRDFADRVRWLRDWTEAPAGGFHGTVFGNELLDAFPIHRIGWDAVRQEWFEWGVRLVGNRFDWARLPLTAPAAQTAAAWPSALVALLPDGFTTEVNPAALDWWRQAAMALRRGRLLTLDYGLEAEGFLLPSRAHGTVRAYRNHQLSPDLLADPGQQDLTAHVNWTAIRTAGEAEGLRTEGLWSQENFLLRIVRQATGGEWDFAPWTPERTRQLRTLTHPGFLGSRFQVLIQSRH